MSTITEAQAPQLANYSNHPATPAPETSPAADPQNLAALDPQAQHEQLAQLLTNPDWMPETSATSTMTDEPPAGAEPRETGAVDRAEDEPPEGFDEEAPADGEDHDETEAGPESRDKGKRFRFSDPADRQFAVLRKEGIAPDEAARIAYGIGSTPASAPMAEAAAATPTVDPLTAWQQQLREVDARLAAAGGSEGLISEDIVELFRQRSDLAAEIRSETRYQEREAQARAARAAEAVAQARASQHEALVSVVERVPQVAAPGTALRREADRLLQLYRGSAFLDEPNAPFTLVEMAAANVAKAQSAAQGTSFAVEFGKLDQSIAPATPPAPAAAVKTVTARKITPASGAQATQRPDKPATEAERYRDAQATLDPRAQHEALNRLLYGS
jgi:hypothetical protein